MLIAVAYRREIRLPMILRCLLAPAALATIAATQGGIPPSGNRILVWGFQRLRSLPAPFSADGMPRQAGLATRSSGSATPPTRST